MKPVGRPELNGNPPAGHYSYCMSVEQLKHEIERLPRSDLGHLVQWLDNLLERASGQGVPQESELSGGERDELLRRRDAVMAEPALAQPLDDEYFANLKRDLANARPGETSGG